MSAGLIALAIICGTVLLAGLIGVAQTWANRPVVVDDALAQEVADLTAYVEGIADSVDALTVDVLVLQKAKPTDLASTDRVALAREIRDILHAGKSAGLGGIQ